ncbi:replicative DNA helicase [Actinomadura macrotermitis]|uniref:Replicative DNA helicase n=1 Tax=Actinomadura macrotermitis TaxID=2585200 RepID=A0A7K0BW00_9ACTN|nr:replicative DNA helicase [Actinomadura macrotermitis]MQY05349.1 hypothetical protein [Actinomadura macrotermitis]
MSVTELGSHEPEFERTPPHDIAAEQGVLGGMLLSQDAIAEVVEELRTGDFYRPAHQIIWDAILDLYGRGEPADAVTIVGELTKRGEIARVGGAPYLHTLISSVPTAANAGYYAKIVRERSVLRKLVETGTRIVQMGYAADGADADDVLDRAQAEVFAIAEKRAGEDYVPLSEIMPGALDEIEAIGSRGGQMTGVPTGFADLDALTNGLHSGQMIVVAARPAMGKALKTDTPLPTPTGWTTMGEVQVGDHLIGADGRPTRVVAATEVMHGRPCYEVEFSDGEVITADADHQWRTTTREPRSDVARPHTVPWHTAIQITSLCGSSKSIASAAVAVRLLKERALIGNGGAFSTALDGSSFVVDEARPTRSRPIWPQNGELATTTHSVSLPVAGKSGIAAAHTFSAPHLSDGAGRPFPEGSTSGGKRPGAVGAHCFAGSIPTAHLASARGRCELPQALRTAKRFARPGSSAHPAGTGGSVAGRHHLSMLLNGGRMPSGSAASARQRPGHPVVKSSCRPNGHLLTPSRAVRTTAELAATLRHHGDGLSNHAVEVAAPFVLPAAGLPVDPTLLGAWLAGTEVDEQTEAAIRSITSGKRIPAMYLRASQVQRRALLTGMQDVAGLASENGQARLTFTDRGLAEDVRELVLSLGHQVTAAEQGEEHRIDFTPADTAHEVRYIVDVRPVESVPVRCVQVDNDDHMYLAGRSCVPTHNSTLALDFARAASIKHGLTSAFFSLEMGRNEITMRLLSAEARVALHAMRSGTMQDEDWTRLARRMSEVAEAPLFIDDSPNMSMMEIRAKCRRLKQQHDLRLVVIDYLQLMTSGKRVESRQVEVSEFSRSLKLLAKELQVPVIALSQLNRGPEQRTDKKPMVSDLRESGSIEQDADMVILLHREDAYEKESPRAGEADLIVAKHRNGPTATVTVAFQGHYSRFVDMAQ